MLDIQNTNYMYKISYLKNNKGFLTLLETNTSIYISNSKEKILNKLQQEDSSGLFFSCNNEINELSSLIKVLINVKNIGCFCFFFEKDSFDITLLENKINKLKDMECVLKEAKSRKIFEMLDMVMTFEPRLGYCDTYIENIFKYNFIIPFLFIMNASPEDKEEKNIKNKKDFHYDLIVSFFTPFLIFVTFFGILKMFKKSPLYYFLLIICEIVNFFSFSYYIFERNKDNNFNLISCKKKHWYICNLLGVVIAFGFTFLYEDLKTDYDGIKEILLPLLSSCIFTLIFLFVEYFLSFLLNLYFLRRGLNNQGVSTELIENCKTQLRNRSKTTEKNEPETILNECNSKEIEKRKK